LSKIASTPGYSTRVMELVERIHSVFDLPGVLAMLRSTTCTIGAEAGAYAVAIPEDESVRTLKILLAGDPLWGYAQWRACPIEEHPWFVYATEHHSPQVASRIPVITDAQHAAIAVAREHGFASALVVPTHCGGGLRRFGILCLGSSVDGDFEAQGTHVVHMLARSLAMELHEWFAHETRDSLLRATRLRALDLKLLTMQRYGLGSKAIAKRIGMSATSVDSRFRRINTRLACPSRKIAARRAAEYGLI